MRYERRTKVSRELGIYLLGCAATFESPLGRRDGETH